MRVVGTLDEAVEEDCHLIHLLDTASHDIDELFHTVLKEEEFNLLRIGVEDFVCYHFEGFNHEEEEIVSLLGSITVSRACAGDGRVHIFEALAEEADQVREVKHAAA